ncbi:hypothetical protein HDU79_009685 [Rhizoclosmatium sp. JEL0117]|nr:hypothetical protein HDU79_009685 [Rhizoclosmatium sp. JEL0117]
MSEYATKRGTFTLLHPSFNIQIPHSVIPEHFQSNQTKRDGTGPRHCTIVNPKSELTVTDEVKKRLPERVEPVVLGLGRAGAAWFLVVSCVDVQVARVKAGLGWKDLHVTVAFEGSDSHDVYKGPMSVVTGSEVDGIVVDWDAVYDEVVRTWRTLSGVESVRVNIVRFCEDACGLALKTHSGEGRWLLFRAMVYSQSGRWAEAFQDSWEVVKNEEGLEALARCGEAAFKIGELSVALRVCWKAWIKAEKEAKSAVKDRVWGILKKLWKKGVVNVEAVDDECSYKIKLTEDELKVYREARIGLVEESAFVEQSNAVIAKPKLLLENGHRLPRRFSWVIPLLLAGMSTPKCSADIGALKQLGIRTVITLTEEEPLPREWFTEHGLENLFWPITNYYPVSIAHADKFNQILLKHMHEKNGGVLVHCGGGIGRAGSLLATYLIRYGLRAPPSICSRCEMQMPIYCEDSECAFGTGPSMSAADAISLLRAIRPASIETNHQEQFLSDFASALFKRSGNQTRIYSPIDKETMNPTPGEIKCQGQRTPSPQVIVMCGLPGSGKSWFSETLTRESKKWVAVSQDEIGSRDACERMVGVLGKDLGNKSVLIDRVNPTVAERAEWIKMLGGSNKAVVVYFDAGKDVCIERAAWRLGHPTVRANAAKNVVSSFADRFETPTMASESKHFQAVYTVSSFSDSIALLAHFGIKIDTESTPTGFVKYPRTRHLFDFGSASRDDLFLNDDLSRYLEDPSVRITVEEKIDGANVGFRLDVDGNIVAQNRTHVVTSSSHAQFQGLGAWIFRHREVLERVLGGDGEGKGRILFGEWMVARHSVSYDALPDVFVAFDLYDIASGRFLSRERFWREVEGSGVCVVPRVEYSGLGKGDLGRLIEGRSMFSTKERREGVVVRVDRGDWLEAKGKVVRADFICGNEHWSKGIIEKNKVVSMYE